jgi:hypothetical protein
VACADKMSLDYIVTRDEELLKLPNAILPIEFLTITMGVNPSWH